MPYTGVGCIFSDTCICFILFIFLLCIYSFKHMAPECLLHISIPFIITILKSLIIMSLTNEMIGKGIG